MALKCVRRVQLAVPCTSHALSCLSQHPHQNDKRRKVPYLLVSLLPTREFHHQNLIQFFIQQRGPSGVLFESLQKHRTPAKHLEKEEKVPFHIPDELRRLKQGSLRWLFEVWPASKRDPKLIGSIPSGLSPGGPLEPGEEDKGKKKKLRTREEQQLHDVLDYLKSRNIAVRRLVRLPWLLNADPDALEVGVERVRRWLGVKPFEVAISFVKLNTEKLQQVSVLWRRERLEGKWKTRLDWLASKLKCPPEDVADMMARCPYLMTVPVENIERILEGLEELQASAESIISDPWVFGSNLSRVHERMEVLRKNGIQQAKPWVFRISPKAFDKWMGAQLHERKLLGQHENVRGFLEEKLGGGKKGSVDDCMKKCPALENATVATINEKIEFLTEAGYNPEEIMEIPRVLTYSMEKLSERLEELSRYNMTPSLPLLCRSNKDFNTILKRLGREEKTRKSSPKEYSDADCDDLITVATSQNR